jgi:hypothetical protein
MYSFPLGEEEKILKKGHASLHLNENAFTGAFYLTNERLVFVGYVMDINMKHISEVPLTHISEIQGGKTFYLIANTLQITTIGGDRLKVIVDPGTRNGWLKAIREEMTKI